MLKCLLAAVSLERNANPVIHLFHLGWGLQWQHSPALRRRAFLTLLRRLALARDVSAGHASKAPWIPAAETNATLPVRPSLVHHPLHGLSRSPFLEYFLVTYPVALDSVRETGRGGWGMSCKSMLVTSEGQRELAFAPGSDLGLLVAALERERSKQGISSAVTQGAAKWSFL